MLQIRSVDSTNATAQVVPAARVQKLAIAVGNPYGGRAVGITAPKLKIDQHGLHYEQRRASGGGAEFRFEKGSLLLTLVQEVLLSDELSECAQRYFDEHEQGHVRDNREVFAAMEKGILADPGLAKIFVDRVWHPRDQFNQVQKDIERMVGGVFQTKTGAAVVKRDTPAEYARIEREIRNHCTARRESARDAGRSMR